MDRRSEPRSGFERPAEITDLTHSGQTFPGVITDLSEGGVRIVVDHALPLDAAVRVELEDALLLGEVCYCNPRGGRYAIGLALQHSLANLGRQAQVKAAFLGEPAEVGLASWPVRTSATGGQTKP